MSDLPRDILALLAGGLEEDAYFGELLVFIGADVSLCGFGIVCKASVVHILVHTLWACVSNSTYAIAIETVFVEDALPESRANLVTCLTAGESEASQRNQSIVSHMCLRALGSGDACMAEVWIRT